MAEYDEQLRGIGVYPSTSPIKEDDILTREEAIAQEEKILGKRGVSDVESPLLQPLDDPMPDFLHLAAKAGPEPEAPLDCLGRKKVVNMLGEKGNTPTQLPAIINPSNDIKVKKPQRTVTLVKDHDLEYPDLYMSVFVLPDPDEPADMARYARMFARSGCYGAKRLEDADLVIFSGGSDVDPRMYNEDRHEMTYFDSARDDRDMEAYLICLEQGIPMLGVCRGAQFLHVMNGGKLYQHVDNHYGPHKMKVLNDTLLIENVSSRHHQSVRQNIRGGMKVIGVTHKSTVRWKNNEEKDEGPKPDIEAFFYRDTGCFGVQGHPEYQGYNRFQTWVLEMINELFLMSPDYEWASIDNGGRYRMKPDLIKQRAAMKYNANDDENERMAEYVEQAYSPKTEA